MSADPAASGPWWRRDASEMAGAYRQGTISPLRVLDDCLARIGQMNPALNAFVALRADAALAEARQSAARFASGRPLGPLDGIPIAIKDNIPTADLPTTWGSVSAQHYRPARDEAVVARLRAAGALIVGKTNVPEFTLEGYTANRLFGVTRNPWDHALTPGGSSGGSVAAVASGMVPLALGTDGGGSTRRPASHTGLIGLKPSIGAIARHHALPPLLLDFEVIGPIARTTADLRMLFAAVRGPHPLDRSSMAAQALRKPLPRHLRIRYVPTLDGAPVDPQIAASCRRAVDALATHGHQVDSGALPIDLGPLNRAWPTIGQTGLAWLFEHHPMWRQAASPRYLEMAAQGAGLSAAGLWQLLDTVESLRRDCAGFFEKADLIVTPAAAALPWPADQPYPPQIDGQNVGPRGHAIFTGWVNAAGLPALAIPCEPSAQGLPIGMQLIGDYGTDDALLELAGDPGGPLGRPWSWPVD